MKTMDRKELEKGNKLVSTIDVCKNVQQTFVGMTKPIVTIAISSGLGVNGKEIKLTPDLADAVMVFFSHQQKETETLLKQL